MAYERVQKTSSQTNTKASHIASETTIQKKPKPEVDYSELTMPGYTPLPDNWDASQHFLLKNRTRVKNDVVQAKMSNDGGGMTTQPKTAAMSVVPPNSTGMPDQLKAGLEHMSGMDLSEVRVHRNSSKPSQVQALAYTQGANIYLGPGQERHLPHEGWHVVQQREGRVRPTMQMAGASINDDAGLEREADTMGQRTMDAVKTTAVLNSGTEGQNRSSSKQHGDVVVQFGGKDKAKREEVDPEEATPTAEEIFDEGKRMLEQTFRPITRFFDMTSKGIATGDISTLPKGQEARSEYLRNKLPEHEKVKQAQKEARAKERVARELETELENFEGTFLDQAKDMFGDVQKNLGRLFRSDPPPKRGTIDASRFQTERGRQWTEEHNMKTEALAIAAEAKAKSRKKKGFFS